MKRYKRKKRIKIDYDLSSIHCNKCGEKYDYDKDVYKKKFKEYFEVIQDWSYYSPWDGKQDYWDLCQTCYTALVKSFKIPMFSSK